MAAGIKLQHELSRIVGDLLQSEIAEKQARSIRYQMTVAIFVVAPWRCLPPVECCRGVRPSQAEKSRALVNVSGGGANTAMAVAISRAALAARCGATCPNAARWPRRALITCVRRRIRSSRMRKIEPWRATVSSTMARRRPLGLLALHEAHRQPHGRFADRLGVGRIIFLGLTKGFT